MVSTRIFTLILLTTLLAGQDLCAEAAPRRILALYDGRNQTPAHNHIHENAEVILNYLGCAVDYHDVHAPLPDDRTMNRYRGVLTWFYTDAMADPEAYLQWGLRQLRAGRKFVILGNPGAFKHAETGRLVDKTLLEQFYAAIGFRQQPDLWTDSMPLIELVFKDATMVEFERSLDYELSNYAFYRLTQSDGEVYLKLRRNDLPNSESDLVFTTPQGGLAASHYVLYQDPETFKRQWRLNPFAFFNEAFALHGLPRPDVTTLNGMRIWCSHIDGDGLISRSEIRSGKYCGEVILNEILRKYKWPISVSVVIAEVQTAPKFDAIARAMYDLDWVEAASHSYSHPFYWSEDYKEKARYPQHHLPIEGYTFNERQEVIGSVAYINNRLMPSQKQVKQFFWTGNCEPTVAAMRYCEQLELDNFNGGDTVFDRRFPSYTGVAPLSTEVGGYRQIYSPNANENIYTDLWRGPYYGFKFVLDTFRNTEAPRRIKPINVYYHFYIGEKWAALNSLNHVLETTSSMTVAPMFVSEYIAMVHGFYSAEIEKIAADGWLIRNYGACTTMRFDHTARVPDLRRSQHVLGFYRHQGALYVHLENRDQARVFLTDARQTRPYLKQGSHRVSDWYALRRKVTFSTGGWGRGEFAIANLHANAAFAVTLDKPEQQVITARSDAEGALTFKCSMTGPVRITIEMQK